MPKLCCCPFCDLPPLYVYLIVFLKFWLLKISVRGSFGVRSGFARGPREVHSGSVRGPFGVRSESVRDPFGIRSGSFGVCSGSVPSVCPSHPSNLPHL